MTPVDQATAFRDHYAVLGVDVDADDAEIRTAFWELAKRHHPDVNQGGVQAVRRFARISEAKTVLLSPALRAQFDREREAFLRTGVAVRTAPGVGAEPVSQPRHAPLAGAMLLAGAATVLLALLLLPLASLPALPDPVPVHAFDPGVIAGFAFCAACLCAGVLAWPAWRRELHPARWEILVAFLLLWFGVTVAGQVDPHLLLGGHFSSDLGSAGGGEALLVGVGTMLGGGVLLHPAPRGSRHRRRQP